MASSVDIASRIFSLYKEQNHCTIDEMKLHKLLYFAQKESMVRYNEPLFNENFEAWKYGPVLKSIRSYYKNHLFPDFFEALDNKIEEIIAYVLEKYGIMSSWALSDISHEEICWNNARKGLPKNANCSSEKRRSGRRKTHVSKKTLNPVFDQRYASSPWGDGR